MQFKPNEVGEPLSAAMRRSPATATRQQAILTGRMFEASQRPWVALKATIGGDPRKIVIGLDLENFGSVPAIVKSCRVRIADGERVIHEDSTKEDTGSRLALFPRREQNMTLMDLAGQQLTAVLGSPRPLTVDATVRYESYGRSYSTQMVARIAKPTTSDGHANVLVERHDVK